MSNSIDTIGVSTTFEKRDGGESLNYTDTLEKEQFHERQIDIQQCLASNVITIFKNINFMNKMWKYLTLH